MMAVIIVISVTYCGSNLLLRVFKATCFGHNFCEVSKYQHQTFGILVWSKRLLQLHL